MTEQSEHFVSLSLASCGVLAVRGEERIDLLQRLSTNDLHPLKEPGLSRWTVFTTNQGKVVDWCRALAGTQCTWIQTSAGRAERLGQWIDHYTVMEDVATTDESETMAALVVQGPGAVGLVGLDPQPGRIIERDGLLWTRGLAAFAHRLEAVGPRTFLEEQLAALAARGGHRVEQEHLERLRIMAGVPSPSAEFLDEVNPLELRLASSVSWDKGCYVGQEVIARLDTYDKVARYLMGVVSDQSIDVPSGTRLSREGKPLGRVTSWCTTDNGAMGLAVVKREAACASEAELEVAEQRVPIRLEDRPFWAVTD